MGPFHKTNATVLERFSTSLQHRIRTDQDMACSDLSLQTKPINNTDG